VSAVITFVVLAGGSATCSSCSERIAPVPASATIHARGGGVVRVAALARAAPGTGPTPRVSAIKQREMAASPLPARRAIRTRLSVPVPEAGRGRMGGDEPDLPADRRDQGIGDAGGGRQGQGPTGRG